MRFRATFSRAVFGVAIAARVENEKKKTEQFTSDKTKNRIQSGKSFRDREPFKPNGSPVHHARIRIHFRTVNGRLAANRGCAPEP
jgi:hypothetical protein